MYQYQCTILNWLDGDTCDIEIDLGLRIYHRVRVRLAGVDTPELTSREPSDRLRAAQARNRAIELCPPGHVHTISTNKPDPRDKYGRWLIEIPMALDGGLTDLASVMIAEGLGRPYHGGSR